VSVDVTIHTHAFAIVGPVGVLAGSGLASFAAPVHMIAVVAHTFCVVLGCLVWAVRDSFSFASLLNWLLLCDLDFLDDTLFDHEGALSLWAYDNLIDGWFFCHLWSPNSWFLNFDFFISFLNLDLILLRFLILPLVIATSLSI